MIYGYIIIIDIMIESANSICDTFMHFQSVRGFDVDPIIRQLSVRHSLVSANSTLPMPQWVTIFYYQGKLERPHKRGHKKLVRGCC